VTSKAIHVNIVIFIGFTQLTEKKQLENTLLCQLLFRDEGGTVTPNVAHMGTLTP